MATDQDFADYVLEQLRHVPRVRHRKMFGEYAVYSNDKVVARYSRNTARSAKRRRTPVPSCTS
ncbi:MAG: hypothetical protein O2973_11375 [Gemmatimonadetes bacterium]|nr:hypothetical protein [Gemmatimonadota bacterium]